MQLRSNGFWLQYLSSRLQYDEPVNSIFDFNERLKAVSAESVRATAAQYLNDKNYIRLVLMPAK